MKACTKCGEAKPLEDFTKDKRSKDGRCARCKVCWNAANMERYHANGYRAKQREWENANREKVNKRSKEWARQWRAANPDAAREKAKRGSAKFREANPDYSRRWYQANIEKERERSKLVMRNFRTNPANREREREWQRAYRENNIDVVRNRERENTQRRRAFKQGTSRELAAFMAELITQPCAYCETTENITIDHIIPLSRGGKHEAENLAPACLPCNCSKNDRLLSEWSGRLDAAA